MMTARKPRGKITDPAHMIAMHRDGASIRTIAEYFSVQPPAITRALNNLGVKVERKVMDRTAAMQERRDRDRVIARARLGDLAELVANGLTIPTAAERMGFSHQRGYQMWADIRADLGWQAV